ncbi:OmpA family protein [uncultured Sphaerotilus sp.]|uniref:OmpA family protein n=1 Tax=uncultured Sphaerotilus sp. TaxID=474984 RepID=UPI0030CA33C3
MRTMHALRTLTTLMLAGFGALSTTAALAQLRAAPYAYGGLSVGQSRAKVDENRIANSQLGAGLTTSSVTSDETDTAYRIFGGYQFTRNIGLEAGYFDLGKFGLNATTVPAGNLIGEIKNQGAHLDLVGTLPVTDRLSALARIGAHYSKSRGNFRGTGAVTPLNPIPSTRETNVKLGVGLQYAVNSAFLVRGEIDRYQVNDSVGHRGGVNVVSMSVVFPFGSAPEPTRMTRAEPAYVAPVVAAAPPAPEPAPVIVAAPVAPPAPPAPPPRRRVSFTAESLFTFDQSNVQPEGRAALDKFASELAGTQYETISVEGHTDRLGKPAYNQKLSMERATAVKDHLVSTGHIDPAKISATGKGESTPVTKAEDCKGNRQTPALVTCLQPDRRVEIEVTGTK